MKSIYLFAILTKLELSQTLTVEHLKDPRSDSQCSGQNRIIGGEPITSGNSPFSAEWIVYLDVGCSGVLIMKNEGVQFTKKVFKSSKKSGF